MNYRQSARNLFLGLMLAGASVFAVADVTLQSIEADADLDSLVVPTARISGPEFEALVKTRVEQLPEYRALANKIKLAELDRNRVAASNNPDLRSGALYRPRGQENASVSEFGGYLRLRQNLFDAGVNRNELKARDFAISAEAASVAAAAGRLQLEFVEQYLGILGLENRLAALGTQLSFIATTLERLKERRRLGMGQEVETQILEGRWQTSHHQLRAGELDLELQIATFEQQFGLLPAVRLVSGLQGAILMDDTQIAEVLARNADIKSIVNRIESHSFALKAEKRKRLPQIDFNLNYAESNLEHQLFPTVELSYPLFDGKRHKVEVQVKALQLHDERLRLQVLQTELSNQLASLLMQHKNAVARARVYHDLLMSKARLFITLENTLKNIRGGPMDLVSVVEDRLSAQIDRDGAYFQALVLQYEIELMANSIGAR